MSVTARHGNDVSGTEPSPIIWNRFDSLNCLLHKRGFEFWEDFRSLAIPLAQASNAAVYTGNHGWFSYEDTGDAVTQLATDVNGVLNVSIAATNNNETWLQAGSATTVNFCPRLVADGGTSIFYEARVNMSTLVGNMFVGLAEEASAAANFIADASGTMADKDYIGFLVDEDAPTVCRFVYHKASGTAVDVVTSAHTFVADTFVKLGFIIDMDETDTAKRIKAYVNGVESSSYGTDTQFTNTTDFPSGEELAPIFGGKNNNAAKVVRCDWIRCGQMRVS